uniref:VWFA domain-containing protein n=1 Tax=Timema poppense TaxID=170557 RepID=A0A7R9CXE8_TIMPO|nr:unnamed protein product [Timema poppensis]
MAERSSQPLLSISSLFPDLDQSVFLAMKTSAVVVILTAVFWCGDVNAQDKSLLSIGGQIQLPRQQSRRGYGKSGKKSGVWFNNTENTQLQRTYVYKLRTTRCVHHVSTWSQQLYPLRRLRLTGDHPSDRLLLATGYFCPPGDMQCVVHHRILLPVWVTLNSRNSNRFTVSVNIESEKKVTFNLTYEELLKRELSVYNHAININPGQIVPDLSVEVYINESSKITTLEVPALKESNEINQENATQGNPLAKIERLSDTSAIIRWAPTPEEQKQLNSEGVKGQLVVRYDVDRESHPQQILVNEGYFVHFFAPSNLPTLNKHVTFVLDVSGSMSGRKIEQLREAMTTILSDLRPGDFFSIIIFSTYVQVWDPEHIRPQVIDYNYYSENKERTTPQELLRSSIVPATPANIRIAKEFVGSLVDDSSTNIYGALLKALDVVRLGRNLTSSNDVLYENPEPMIIFLTDGQPNEEESDLTVIADTVTASNKNASAAIFCLAFGENADLEFLKKLSLRNSGFARKIYEASDAAIQLQDFYRQVASPLLADVSFNYTEGQVEEGSVSKTHFNTLFLGSEFVVTGKLKSTELTGGLTARSPNGTTSLPFGPDIIVICPRFPPTGEPTEEHNVTNASFMERLWAYLTIQQLLEKDKVDSPPEVNTSSPNKMKALEIALKYSFVTPLTSLVVVKPNETTSADTEKGDTTSPDFGRGYPHANYAPAVARAGIYPQSIRFGGGVGAPGSISQSSLDDVQLETFEPALSTMLPLSGLTIVPLSSLTWLNNVTSEAGITLPNQSTGRRRGSTTWTESGELHTNSAFSDCTTSLGGSGHCRHLPYCALDVFTLNVTDYLPFFCRIDTQHQRSHGATVSYSSTPGPVRTVRGGLPEQCQQRQDSGGKTLQVKKKHSEELR